MQINEAMATEGTNEAVTLPSVEHVYLAIKQAISEMRYAPGESVREAELARSLGVSRTPVREAFRRLGAEGWLEIRPNQGARVRRWSTRDVEEIFEARALIEPYLVGCAVACLGTDEVATLRRLALEMRDVARAMDADGALERWFEANRTFHDMLTSAAGNTRLRLLLAQMKEVPLIKWTFRNYSETDRERSVQQHLDIVDALENGDADWAQAVMKAHILGARAAVLEALRLTRAAPQDMDNESNDTRRQPHVQQRQRRRQA